MLTCSKTRVWSEREGSLRLSAEDLNDAAPLLGSVLLLLSKAKQPKSQKFVCKVKSSSGCASTHFVFNTGLLLRLLRPFGYAAGGFNQPLPRGVAARL